MRALVLAAVLTGPSPAPQRVDVVIHGTDDAASAVAARLHELLEPGGRELVIRRSAAIDLSAALATGSSHVPQIAQVWLELADDGRIEILVLDGDRARALVRDVATPDGIDEAAREAIATIVASAVDAIEDGEAIGVSRREAEAALAPSVPDPVAPPAGDAPTLPIESERPPVVAPTLNRDAAPARPRWPTSTRARLAAEIGWHLHGWSSSAPVLVHGPTLALVAVASRSRLQPGAVLLGQYRLPAVLRDGALRATLGGGMIRALATIEPRVAERVQLRARAGLGIELLRVATSGIADAAPTAVHALPAFALALGVAAKVAPRLALAADVLVDVDLFDTKLVLQRSGQTVFDPWRARPGVGLTLVWDLVAPQ